MHNYRTTIAGVCAIVAALAGAGAALANGAPVDYPSVLAAIMAGVGLITAHDAKNTIAVEPKK